MRTNVETFSASKFDCSEMGGVPCSRRFAYHSQKPVVCNELLYSFKKKNLYANADNVWVVDFSPFTDIISVVSYQQKFQVL